MTDDSAREAPPRKPVRVQVQAGKPLQFTDVAEAETPNEAAIAIARTIGKALKAYREAVRKLLEGKYANMRQLAPPHMRQPCDVFVVQCSDGILVRYDHAQQEPKTRCAATSASLAGLVPTFSEQVVHFPRNPSTYIPAAAGPELILTKTEAKTGVTTEVARFRPLIYASIALPEGFEAPQPPARPPCLVSVTNELDFGLQGEILPSESSVDQVVADSQFITHSRFKLPVGWQTIEVYPLLGAQYWDPGYAPMWAELDLLAFIAQRNAIASNLNAIDGRGAARKRYADLLEEFGSLLTGPEEPAHQFLKQHPELLCPTNDRFWSKLHFGDRVSDFVFREPYHEYLLVEIEAPYRELFRKDGQQREELTHAINQIADWVQYITDNKEEVETKLGLEGVSTNPRTLVVIGRSASLTEENRRKLVTLQSQQSKMRILTYDDLIAAARANLERILGPLDNKGQNVDVYYFSPSNQISSPALSALNGQDIGLG